MNIKELKNKAITNGFGKKDFLICTPAQRNQEFMRALEFSESAAESENRRSDSEMLTSDDIMESLFWLFGTPITGKSTRNYKILLDFSHGNDLDKLTKLYNLSGTVLKTIIKPLTTAKSYRAYRNTLIRNGWLNHDYSMIEMAEEFDLSEKTVEDIATNRHGEVKN